MDRGELEWFLVAQSLHFCSCLPLSLLLTSLGHQQLLFVAPRMVMPGPLFHIDPCKATARALGHHPHSLFPPPSLADRLSEQSVQAPSTHADRWREKKRKEERRKEMSRKNPHVICMLLGHAQFSCRARAFSSRHEVEMMEIQHRSMCPRASRISRSHNLTKLQKLYGALP
jgi:hypothetical protein